MVVDCSTKVEFFAKAMEEGNQEEKKRCPICTGYISKDIIEDHIIRCLKKFERPLSKATTEVPEQKYSCAVCHKDITSLDPNQRTEHVNRCLDQEQQSYQKAEAATAAPNSSTNLESISFILLECPLCQKCFQSSETCRVHIKRCSVRLNISPHQVLEAIKIQQKYAQERLAAGLPIIQGRKKPIVPNAAAPRARSKNAFQMPKTKYASDIQMAKALSASMQATNSSPNKNESHQEEQGEKNAFEVLKQVGVQQAPGRQKRTKKKEKSREPPILLLRTDEERNKIWEAKIAVLLAPKVKEEFAFDGEEKPLTSSSRILSLASKEQQLWKLSTLTSKKEAYYVCSLENFITPSIVEAGSKLKSLSQIPGGRLTSSFLCEKLPNAEDEKSQSKTPSVTQTNIETLFQVLDTGAEQTQCKEDERELEDEVGFGFLSQKSLELSQKKKEKEDNILIEKLSSELTSLVGSERFSDLTVKVKGNILVPAHRALLCTRSPAIDKEVTYEENLDWSEVSKQGALDFIAFLYTGRLNIDTETVFDIKKLALRYKIEQLIERLQEEDIEVPDNEEDNPANHSLDGIISFLWKDEPPSPVSKHMKEPPVPDDDDNDEFDEVYGFMASQKGPTKEAQDEKHITDDEIGQEDIFTDICSSNAELSDHHLHQKNSVTVHTQGKNLENPSQSPQQKENLLSARRTSQCSSSTPGKDTSISSPDLFDSSHSEDSSENLPCSQVKQREPEMSVSACNKILNDSKELPEANISSVNRDSLSSSEKRPHEDTKASSEKFYASVMDNCYPDFTKSIDPASKRMKVTSYNISRSQPYQHGNVIDLCDETDVKFSEQGRLPYSSSQDSARYKQFELNSFVERDFQRHLSPRKYLHDKSVNKSVHEGYDFRSSSPYPGINENLNERLQNERAFNRSNKTDSSDECLGMSGSHHRHSSERRIEVIVNSDRSSNRYNNMMSSDMPVYNRDQMVSSTSGIRTKGHHYSENSNHHMSDSRYDPQYSYLRQGPESLRSSPVSSRSSYPDMYRPHSSRSFESYDADLCNKSDYPEVTNYVDIRDDNENDNPAKTELSDSFWERLDQQEYDNQFHPLEEAEDKGKITSSCDESEPNSRPSTPHPNTGLALLPSTPDSEKDVDKGGAKEKYPARVLSTSVNIDDEEGDEMLRNFDVYERGSKVGGIGVPSQLKTPTNRGLQSKQSSNNQSVTPMPDYATMRTPTLKEELKKYGVKAMPRKKALNVLTHIYEETHPWETESEKSFEEQPAKELSWKPEPVYSMSQLANRIERDDPNAFQRPFTSQRSRSLEDKSDDNLPSSQTSNTSSVSEHSDLLEETMFQGDEDELDSPDLHTKLKKYIFSRPELYEKVLAYEPLNFVELQDEMKAGGVKVSAKNLTDFLDDQGITFTMPRSEKQRDKQRRRQDRFKKRVKGRLRNLQES